MLGFDVEWDSLTAADKKRQKPEVMQLATADGNYIAVIKLSCVFPGIQPESTEAMVVKYSVLKSVFDHPRIRASGVGVKGDITRFLKHYHEGLVGLNLQKRVFDATAIGQKQYVVKRGRHEGRLEDLMEKLLGKRIEKVCLK